MHFTCPRSCRWAERQDVCRFQSVFAKLGEATISSHTVRVRVELKDADSLKAAVEAMGGKWLGDGPHKLYENSQTGFGFMLPGWRYPLVLDKTGELHFDDFSERWGKTADIERLKGEYTIACAFNAVVAQGWQAERSEAGLLIMHPNGGTLTVTAGGIIDANGFMGVGCHEAIMSLGMSAEWSQAKVEFGQVACEVQEGI